MNKHTPGPWNVEKRWSNGCEVGPWIMTDREPNGTRHIIAEIGGAPYIEGDGGKRVYADARLIAAAPALLEACQAVANRLDYLSELWGQEGVTRSLMDQVRSALALATKEDPS